MSSIIDGETQGQKHKIFNKLVMEAVTQKKALNYSLDYDDTDIENLFKVDIASHTRNVDFILKVLKCQDILFVSRAIRQCSWLVEPEYAHIINPQYLYTQLYSSMMSEARNKLIHLIQLNLRDPTRCEDFFDYLEKKDTNAAMKWFPKCSIEFILSRLRNNIYIIPEHIILRLFPVSFEVFKIYCDVFKKSLKLEKALFLIKSNGEDFFDILDGLSKEQLPILNKKNTKLAMKLCPHRLMFNFDHYQNHIDIQCFVKYIHVKRFQEFQAKYSANEKLINYFGHKSLNILRASEGDNILVELSTCDPNNLNNIKNILITFNNIFSKLDIDLIFTFINKFISKCKIHQFDSAMWNIYNDIFKKIMNIKEYSENNVTISSYIHSIVFYKVIHNEIITDDTMVKFKFNSSLKVLQRKLCAKEIDTVFDYLLNYALTQLDKTENRVIWIENMFMLLKVWNKSIQHYSNVDLHVIKVVQELQSACDYETLEELYSKKNFWRKYLLNENIVIQPNSSATFLNMLKHNPGLLLPLDQKKMIISEEKQAIVFYRKLRTYWSNSLAQEYKEYFRANLIKTPSVGLFILLSKKEYQHLIQCNAPNIINQYINENRVEINIARNMHKVYPKLSIEMALLYFKGFSMTYALSSINSLLHGMPMDQLKESIESLDMWPELVQKLCIWVIFSQGHYEKQQLLFTIWQNTKYSSVRAEIYKKTTRYLCVQKNVDFNIKYNYISMIEDKWLLLQSLMDNLRKEESLIVDQFPHNYQRYPLMRASDFCLKSYQIMKSFPSYFKVFPRKPLMHYFSGGLHLVNDDLLADMVNDIITERLWVTKLNYHHVDIVTSCIYRSKVDAVVSYQKFIAPLFMKAYDLWDSKTVNCHLVRLNINKIVTKLNEAFQCFIDHTSNFTASVLILLLESLENNLSVKDNYMMVRKLMLTVEYFEILAKADAVEKFDVNTNIFDKTAAPFAGVCLKTFCNDIKMYGHSIWRLFYHALQETFDRFDVGKPTQYKIYNLMLDLSAELTPEVNMLVHVLIFDLAFHEKDNFDLLFFDDDSDKDEEGRQNLLDRIKYHHSNEIKAIHSKCVLNYVCHQVIYKKFQYT